MFIKYTGILIGAYLLGSLSLSILVSGALFGKDIRTEGSGNAGATNMARVFGWGAGLLTLAGDAAKAVICMVVGNKLGGELGLALAGMGCIFGRGVSARCAAEQKGLVRLPVGRCRHHRFDGPARPVCAADRAGGVQHVALHLAAPRQYQTSDRRNGAGLQGAQKGKSGMTIPARSRGRVLYIFLTFPDKIGI